MKLTYYYLITTIILLSACDSKKRELEQIDFSTDYKFSSEIEHQITTDTIPWKYQISASDYAKKGDYKNALRHYDLGMPTSKENLSESEIDSVNQKYSIVNAKDYIIEEAIKSRIVIINEAHHNSKHRVFTKSLLQDLYEKGYRHFGLEALYNGESMDSALNTRGYPIQKTGYYTQDPQFGNLLREALEIGYHVFAYEYTVKGFGKPREIGQAKNIQKVIEANPEEKFLIHCGFAHAMEGTYESWEKAMAGRLAEYTGSNPLTINQEEYSERSQVAYNPALLKALQIDEPSVLVDQDSRPMKHLQGEAWTDIAVLHPNTQYIDNRPSWLFEEGNRNVAVSLDDVELELPLMVLAFKKAEDIREAVPVDIVEVENRQEQYSLALPKGVYQVVVTDGEKSVKFEQIVQ